MKFLKLFFTLIALLSFTTSSYAVTVQESTSEDYLINSGYSKETARLVNLKKHQTAGKEIKTEKSIFSWPIRMLKKLDAYLDPGIDDGSFGTTDINPGSGSRVENL